MTTISAEVVLKSRNVIDPNPSRFLGTVLLRYPRFIHAELMTHRAFSRNAASSRAIPIEKMIRSILEDTAMPIHWGANQKGMQADYQCEATIPFKDVVILEDAPAQVVETNKTREYAWLKARDNAIELATAFSDAGYHKQVVNRLLEPFMHITTLVSATEWENFFALRVHPAAEPHIRMLAEKIKTALDDFPTMQLLPGEWHLPFVTAEDKLPGEDPDDFSINSGPNTMARIKLSTSRCASTSFKTVEGFDMTWDKAFDIHDKLVGSVPIHASPAEHVAKADDWGIEGMIFHSSHRTVSEDGKTVTGPVEKTWLNAGEHRNFVGFRQYRSMIPGDTQY